MKKKYFAVVLLLLLEIVSLTLMYKSSHNKEVVLDDVSLKEFLKSNMISIMTDETGNGTYTEYTNSTFPSTGYLYNASKSQCINEKGNVVKDVLTYDGTKAVLTSDEGMHCTLYFDKCVGPKGTVLEGKDQINQCLINGLYRYQGTDDVNNYICFGTSDKSKCTSGGDEFGDGIDKYLYRILGITREGELALVKETVVKENSSTYEFQWNNLTSKFDCGSDGSKCTWPLSRLYKRLNGLGGSTTGSEGDSNIFIGNSYYEYLSTGNAWLEKIDSHKWGYGTINDEFDGINNFITNKIGLLYSLDLTSSYPNEETNNSTSWIDLQKNGYNTQSDPFSEWGIMLSGMNNLSNIMGVHYSYDMGAIYPTISSLNESHGVRPVFYLKPDTVLKSGSTGSKTDPYIIDGIQDSISLGEFCDGQTNMGTCMNNKKSTIGSVTNMTSSEVGGMYRYQGLYNINNWICFGTTNKSDCTSTTGMDKYMYRVIGVTSDGQLELIKETPVKEGTITTFQWNDEASSTEASCGADGSKCTWPLSKLYNRLNGLCKSDNPNCSGTGSGTSGQTNIFIGNTYYEYLNTGNTWLSKINPHNWKYGEISESSVNSFNANTVYNIENAFTSNVTAKIGLQYVYDLYNTCPSGRSVMNDFTFLWISTNMVKSIASIQGSNLGEYFISKRSGYNNGFNTNIQLSNSSVVLYAKLSDNITSARPVFYLIPTTKINNATGSMTDPFMILN